MRAQIEEEITMVSAGHIPSTLRELTMASARATFLDLRKEMQMFPLKKLMKGMLGDNIWVSLYYQLSLLFAFNY